MERLIKKLIKELIDYLFIEKVIKYIKYIYFKDKTI